MKTLRRRFSWLLLAAGLVAALPSPVARGQENEERAEQARDVLRRRCLDCHGNQKNPRAGLKVLDYQQLAERQLVRPGAPDTSELLQLVECGSMPPGRLPKVPQAEQQTLRDWIAHGAVPFPPEVGDAYVLRKIARDLEQQQEKDPRAVPYLRYVSFNHLVSDTTEADPQVWRAALAQALNHLSWRPDPVRPVDVEPTHSVFRIDLRDLGWDARPFEVVRSTTDRVPSQVNLFDLVLLEYPFGTLPSLKDRTAILGEYLAQATPVRPVVYVRGDWLVSTITRPPLYEDLLRLPRTLQGLEAKLGIPAVPANQEVRAGFADARSPDLKRLVSRLPGDNGPYWRMWDVRSDRDLANLAREDPPPPGTLDLQVLFGLPNGLQGYFLADNTLHRVDSVSRESLTDPLDRDRGARDGLSCILCHDRGPKPLTDSVRAALERANLDGNERERLLALYPPGEVLKRHLDADSQRFTAALEKVQGRVPGRDPLAEVTRRFLAAAAPSGRGMPGTLTLAPQDRGPKSAVRPAPWEEGGAPGPAVPALDGLTHPAQEPLTGPLPVTLETVNAATGRPTTVFAPGDQMQVLVTNTGDRAVYFELTTTLLSGEQKVLVPVRRLEPKEQFCHPRDTDKGLGRARPREAVRINDQLGKDEYTVYAAEGEFPGAQRLQGEDLADRLVHPLYELSRDHKRVVVRFDPARMMKKTIGIETRPR